MTLENLRKWLPSYRHIKKCMERDRKNNVEWYIVFQKMDCSVWSAFETINSISHYEGIVQDYKMVLRTLTKHLDCLYKEVC